MRLTHLRITIVVALLLALPACASQQQSTATDDSASTSTAVASASDMAEPVELDVVGLEPVSADEIADGTYDIDVDSSSSMFRIVSCKLTVKDGSMTARMLMGGKGYLYVYPGTAEEAAAADEAEYIGFEEEGDAHTFTVPVEKLDAPLPFASYSKKKELWYDRTLVFRADSLPADAFIGGSVTTAETLGLEDGSYTVAVTLAGGSGRATVESPAELVVSDRVVTARIVWSSPNYDYMVVDGERLEPTNTDGNSTFEVPVAGFDYNMPVTADTTAMSKPHEIDYTLNFDSSTIVPTNA